jgi:hypothetical protein
MVYTLGVIGENNLSNDAGPFLNRFLTPVMAGSYHWLDFPRDTFINTHSNIFPGLVFILLAYTSRLEVHAILYLGVLLALVRLWLLNDVIGRSCGLNSAIRRGALWLALSWLVFSISQMSVYEFPVLTIKYGLSNLGTALGVWGLTRYRGKMVAVWLAAGSGIVATMSNASGFALWPSFLIGMWLLGFRRARQFVVLLFGAAISVLPYLSFLFMSRTRSASSKFVSLFRPVLILDILGRPLANGIGSEYGQLPMAEVAASIGVILCSIAAVLLWMGRAKRPLHSAAPLVILVTVGLFTACQISLFRLQISPWYTGVVMDFWIGLTGLAFVLWFQTEKAAGVNPQYLASNLDPEKAAGVNPQYLASNLDPEKAAGVNPQYLASNLNPRRIMNSLSWLAGANARVWSVAAIASIAVLYMATNRTRADKSFYVQSRSPVSAACLRNFRTAPTYCECSLARWLPGNPRYLDMLARPLEENHLSVFAPRQEWSLQGDSILGSVDYYRGGAEDIYWAPGIEGDRAPITDYRQLDLVLAPANSVSWTIDIPQNMEHGEFKSAIAARIASAWPETSPVSCKVSIHGEGEAESVVYSRMVGPKDSWWTAFRVPLDGYRGMTTTIRLSVSGSVSGEDGALGTGALYQYPSIELFLNESASRESDPGPMIPSNTDLSPRFPKTTSGAFRINLQDPLLWNTDGPADPSGRPIGSWSMSNAETILRYAGPLAVRPSEYSHLYIRISASDDVLPRAVAVAFSIDGRSAEGDALSVAVPLLADSAPHSYTFDLKTLGLPSSAVITGIALEPLREGFRAGKPVVQVFDLGFIQQPPGESISLGQ